MAILDEPAEPVFWGANQKGMQASEELSGWRLWLAKRLWRLSSLTQTGFAWLMSKLGAHKQIVNRITEPFAHITVLATATEWGNFFNLRAHKDAQPEFQHLAYEMLTAYTTSEPKVLKAGEWHLPFADRYLGEGLTEEQLLKIVTARAARLSYLNFDGDIDHNKDYDLHDKLVASGHWSPFEHAARALTDPVWVGNFRGYFQYRKLFPKENQREFLADELFARRRKAA